MFNFSVLLRIQSLTEKSVRNHEDAVRHVQRQVQDWKKQGIKTPMCTSRPSYKSITPAHLTYKDRMHKVKSLTSNIIQI